MAQDFIPRPDGDFLTWGTAFLAYAAAHPAELGLAAADLADVTAVRAAWETAYRANAAQQAAARAAKQLKDDHRAACESALRALVRRLQASPAVGDDERKALGLTVRDTIPTPPRAPASPPLAVVSLAERLRHEIRFFDAPPGALPTRRAKPRGMLGCEIWVALVPAGTAPPTDCRQYTFLTLATASPYTAEFDSADAGKTAHYLLRWVTTRGEKGPWSETVAATIAG